MPPSLLLSLPFELRQQIFGLTVEKVGTIELIRPLWIGPEVRAFSQPLFRTSKQVRDDALEAFYKSAVFLWIIYSGPSRSIPAASCFERKRPFITPALPWDYPFLFQHLRHLHLNIYLPVNDEEYSWWRLQTWLSDMVEVLDHGRRLRRLAVLFTSRRVSEHYSLKSQHLQVLSTLSQMEVPGTVKIRTRSDLRDIKTSIESLSLEKTMRSASANN